MSLNGLQGLQCSISHEIAPQTPCLQLASSSYLYAVVPVSELSKPPPPPPPPPPRAQLTLQHRSRRSHFRRALPAGYQPFETCKYAPWLVSELQKACLSLADSAALIQEVAPQVGSQQLAGSILVFHICACAC